MNSPLWNVKNLEPPPRNTYRVTNHNVDIQTLRTVISEAYSKFQDQKPLHEEAALLSRCIYRFKTKFRSDKGLKAMEKTNRALLQYLRMNIPQTLETFHNMIPQKYIQSTYLPTRNMLDYILVRIQGLTKLMIRAVESAKAAALFMELRIGIGHLWKMSLVFFGAVSRIFTITKEIASFCCKTYSQLLPFRKTLKNPGFDWLPSDYTFPENLKLWLNIEWLDREEIPVRKFKKVEIPTLFNMIDSDSEVEFCNDYIEIQDDVELVDDYVEIKEPEKVFKKLKGPNNKIVEVSKLNFIEMEEDVGEAVVSNEAQSESNTSKQNKKKREKLKKKRADIRTIINNIRTLQDLMDFTRDFKSFTINYQDLFKNAQPTQLYKDVKKWTVKAKKSHSDIAKVELYISKAKKVIKASL